MAVSVLRGHVAIMRGLYSIIGCAGLILLVAFGGFFGGSLGLAAGLVICVVAIMLRFSDF